MKEEIPTFPPEGVYLKKPGGADKALQFAMPAMLTMIKLGDQDLLIRKFMMLPVFKMAACAGVYGAYALLHHYGYIPSESTPVAEKIISGVVIAQGLDIATSQLYAILHNGIDIMRHTRRSRKNKRKN